MVNRCGQHTYEPGQPFDGVCRICWLQANREDYRESMKTGITIVRTSKPPPPKTPIHPAGPCIHFGAELRMETCRMCGRRGKQEPIHSCAIWQECSKKPYRHSQPEAVCRGCENYAPPPAPESAPPVMTPEEIARLKLPPGHPPPPPGLTPLPAGRESFEGREWRRLPEPHKEYYRELKRAKEAIAKPAASPPAQFTSTAPARQEASPDRTPFYSVNDRPLDLSRFGQGASCFVVLGGPSLALLDLSQLQRRGIWSIGVNNISAVVKTNAWTFVDSPSKFCDTIWQDPSITKFVHRRFLRRSLRTRKPDGTFENLTGANNHTLLINEMPGVIGMDRNADFRPEHWLSEPSCNWGQSKKSGLRSKGRYPQVLNSMLCVVKIVYALGFRCCYLLGADFSMSPDRPYFFPQGKTIGACASNNSSYQKLNVMFSQLQPHFLSAGFHVYNTNPDSGLTVFPHVPFSTAIKTAIQRVPQNETAADWYDGHAGN